MKTGSSGTTARAIRSAVLAVLACLLVVGFVQPAAAGQKNPHTPLFELPQTGAASWGHLHRSPTIRGPSR